MYLRRASARLTARAALKRESRLPTSRINQWTGWLSHPLILLPWLPQLGMSV
jgi:hypothetical protein